MIAMPFIANRRARYFGAGAQRPATRWTIIGLVLATAYAAQALGDWQSDWINRWQDIELYKQLTGGGLVLLFAAQWRLTIARSAGTVRRANRLLVPHQYWGATAPLWLYLHADDFGHAYIRVMSLCFFSLVLLGLLHQTVTRINRNWLTTAWLVMHIGLAAALIFLIGYHGFNAFYYE